MSDESTTFEAKIIMQQEVIDTQHTLISQLTEELDCEKKTVLALNEFIVGEFKLTEELYQLKAMIASITFPDEDTCFKSGQLSGLDLAIEMIKIREPAILKENSNDPKH